MAPHGDLFRYDVPLQGCELYANERAFLCYKLSINKLHANSYRTCSYHRRSVLINVGRLPTTTTANRGLNKPART
ncbi:hypothetical protein PHLGIDRAFT_189013 [Phlebiopsis gigantea 11061_1 CR5-6]|uniref:Uncharacterized protein n=1 Tax=Phlebiopsis gigantea (strain 11061_1 CR5-6) TaxID=745531 RepID=A0A0C3NIB5_PHLG1|nr:hypothetical protein PHLGIDRAFT_189013 [Phlebiopsis gigantea 11061_1 CR5-6]